MKYPQSVAMPRDVEDWLEEELEALGIDSVVYTRYILSLMLQDSFDLDICDTEFYANPYQKGVWSGQRLNGSFPSSDQHELKRSAVVRCLMAATTKTYGIESLVDQLYTKLRNFQSEGPNDVSVTQQPSHFTSYFGCNNAFRPLQEGLNDWKAVAQPKSARTRGILHVSQPENDAAIPNDDLSPYDFFPLHPPSSSKYGNTLDIYGPRLYERSCNRSLERFMVGLNENMRQYWRPQDELERPVATSIHHDQSFFSHPEVYPSAFKLFGPVAKPQINNWSLGGMKTNVLEKPQSRIDYQEIIKPTPDTNSGKKYVYTSELTHFKAIPYEEMVSFSHSPSNYYYEDGTTFKIRSALEPLEFQRSESGILFLESGKYMEFLKSNDDELGEDEFVPKFRVQQSNEKCCQTDESYLPLINDRDSICSSSLELDDYYYGDDTELTQDLSSDDTPDCGEVAGIVTGCLNVRLKTPSWEGEPMWEAREEAIVDGLVNSPVSQVKEFQHDVMDGSTSDSVAVAPFIRWPSLTSSIWEPSDSKPCCSNCKAKENPFNKLAPISSYDLWSVMVCEQCMKMQGLMNIFDTAEAAYAADDDGNSMMKSCDGLEEAWNSGDRNNEMGHGVGSQTSDLGGSRDNCTYDMMKEELSEDGNQLLSDLSGIHLYQNYGIMTDSSHADYEEEQDVFAADLMGSVSEKGPSVVSFLASLNIFAIGEDETNYDERIYDSAGVQKDRRRRHSSSQRMCEQPLREECRRAHCRYRHYTSPRVLESVCFSTHGLRHARDTNRSFTV